MERLAQTVGISAATESCEERTVPAEVMRCNAPGGLSYVLCAESSDGELGGLRPLAARQYAPNNAAIGEIAVFILGALSLDRLNVIAVSLSCCRQNERRWCGYLA